MGGVLVVIDRAYQGEEGVNAHYAIITSNNLDIRLISRLIG